MNKSVFLFCVTIFSIHMAICLSPKLLNQTTHIIRLAEKETARENFYFSLKKLIQNNGSLREAIDAFKHKLIVDSTPFECSKARVESYLNVVGYQEAIDIINSPYAQGLVTESKFKQNTYTDFA